MFAVIRFLFLPILLLPAFSMAQSISTEALPFSQIPEAPESYSSTTVVARLIDGLGFRYYWATEGLTSENLTYRPTPESRSMRETLEHLHGLAEMTLNAVSMQPNIRPRKEVPSDFAILRRETLLMLEKARTILISSKPEDMEKMDIVFQRDENRSEFPFWNALNGPIADALNHVGQVVSFRRTAGNPQPKGVNVFMGTRKE